MKDERIYLVDIFERIGRIEENAQAGEAAFMQSHTLQDAIIRNFEVIGEAAKRLSPTMRAMQPHIAWAKVASFRDRLIHEYDDVNLALTW